MDTRVASKKLGLKERYAAMTRGLGWETSYQPMDKVFPYDKYEGIKIHDWDKWQDPFRLTMDAYWKYQGENPFGLDAGKPEARKIAPRDGIGDDGDAARRIPAGAPGAKHHDRRGRRQVDKLMMFHQVLRRISRARKSRERQVLQQAVGHDE